MPVMKAQQAAKSRESAIVMDLSDLEREAGRIVADARAQAGRIVAEARATAERETLKILEEARAAGQAEGLQAGLLEGRQQGHDEALAQFQQQFKEVAGRWSQTLDLLQQHMPVHVADARGDLVQLALKIAEKVTRQEGLRNRQVAPALVEEALRMIGSARVVSVRVSPVDLELVRQYLPEVHARLGSIASVEIVSDETVGPAGCVLRFGGGEIDARLEAQLARIAEELGGAA